MKDRLIKLKNKIFKKKHSKTVFKFPEVCLIVAITVIIGITGGCLFTYLAMERQYENGSINANINKDLEKVSDIYDFINNSYYKTIDHDKLINAAIEGMINSLGDPYASYMDKEEKQAFDERMLGEYYGVGVELVSDTSNNVVVSNVFNGTPAKKANIQIGDIIKEINGKSTTGMNSQDVATAIKGSTAIKFSLTLERASQEVTVNVTKEKITLESVTSTIFARNNKTVGYIRITLFANNTYKQFRDALTILEQQNVNSLIIDVRDNSGGYLHTAEDILSMFFKKGSIIYQLQSKDAIIKADDKTDENKTYPVLVLINKNSASASEILASALEENINAEIIGETSYGKGTVQQTQDVSDDVLIKFTIQKWLTPKGNSIDGTGIKPNKEVKMSDSYYTTPSNETDNQLQMAIDEATK